MVDNNYSHSSSYCSILAGQTHATRDNKVSSRSKRADPDTSVGCPKMTLPYLLDKWKDYYGQECISIQMHISSCIENHKKF
eukprot:13363143-Ditylum_brightwellii.AAC.1